MRLFKFWKLGKSRAVFYNYFQKQKKRRRTRMPDVLKMKIPLPVVFNRGWKVLRANEALLYTATQW